MEIAQAGNAIGSQQHVRRLEIAVDHALAVDVAHDFGHIPDQAEGLTNREGRTRESIRHAAVRDELHGKVGRSIPPPGTLHRHELRMRQGGPQLGTAPEPDIPRSTDSFPSFAVRLLVVSPQSGSQSQFAVLRALRALRDSA